MHSFDKMKTYLTQCIGDWCESYLISWGTFQCYTILNFISGNFEDNWILDNRTLLCLDNEMESLTSISPISDETDCKSSSRAVTDLDGSEWEGSQLYIIVGNVGNLRLPSVLWPRHWTHWLVCHCCWDKVSRVIVKVSLLYQPPSLNQKPEMKLCQIWLCARN